MRKFLVWTVAAMVLLVACKSTNGGSTTASTRTTVPVAQDTRAPGVTSDAIKVGVVYVDLASLKDILHIDNGDFAKAYQASIDDINAHGGIHGRKLEATIIGVNPTSQTAADTACTQLTQDDKVFVTVGFFLNDNVLCYVNTNQTAVIGGTMTAARLAQAKAPWYSTDPAERYEVSVAKDLAKAGKLDGKVAVVATAADRNLMSDEIVPALEAAGVKPVSTAVIDVPTNDPTATKAQAATISERFKTAGATQVLVVGQAGGGTYLSGLASTDYRPQLAFTNLNSAQTYGAIKGSDLTVLKNAVTGGGYGPLDAEWALGGPTAACFAVQRKAGLVINKPSTVPAGSPNQIAASGQACTQMALLTAILQKAGPTLNYGTFAAAGNSLGKIVLPGSPDPWDFGATPNIDGNPKVYLYQWDPTTAQFTIAND